MIQAVLCFSGISWFQKLYKSKSTWLSSVIISGEINILDNSISLERNPEIFGTAVSWYVAH